ncbi:hypothetical protein TREPR_1391 [Treponema primitia ZAS-2]|uniref:Uncharacterized protein n=2 Tax=Treponema primitia TaxID=88058 RepID=F5YQQ0_TREPZ|nr:hypothetical protein TREPR_1391 [Treponema primitia ZAS-2]
MFFCTLFLISAITLGACGFIASLIKIEGQARQENKQATETMAILDSLMDALQSDTSPEENGPDDPIWSWDGKTIGNYTVSIRTLSDRLNPNFVRKNIFDKTRLSVLFRPGKTPDELQQYREDHGFSLKKGGYKDFFEDNFYEQYFSPYGWANINLTDEFAARQLGTLLTGSAIKGEALRGKIETLLISQSIMSREGLRTFLGSSWEELYPFVNAEPLMNINFIEPLLLREILSYPDYRIAHYETRCEEILYRRSRETLGQEDVSVILGIGKTHALFYYLGCISWFWEFRIYGNPSAGNNHSRTVILCRIPPSTDDKVDYKIIEERLEYAPIANF